MHDKSGSPIKQLFAQDCQMFARYLNTHSIISG